MIRKTLIVCVAIIVGMVATELFSLVDTVKVSEVGNSGPFEQRILAPLLVNLIGEKLFYLLCFSGLFLVCFRMLPAFAVSSTNAYLVVLAVCLTHLVSPDPMKYYYDASAPFFLALLGLLAMEKRYWWFLLVFPIAVANRETALAMVAVLAVVSWPRIWPVGIALSSFAIVRVVIAVVVEVPTGGFVWTLPQNIETILGNGLDGTGFYFWMLMLYGGLLPLALYGYRDLMPLMKKQFAAFAIVIPSILCFGLISEIRVFAEYSFIVIPAAVFGLERLNRTGDQNV